MSLNITRQLSVAVLQTRNGEQPGYEDFFLLTWQSTYADIKASTEDEETAWGILKDVYVEVWKRRENIPEAGIIRSWICVLIREVSKRIPGRAIEDFPAETKFVPSRNLEDRAATVLISAEEELGLLDRDEEEEKKKRKEEKRSRNIPVTVLKALLSVSVAAAAVLVVIFVTNVLKQSASRVKDLQHGAIDTAAPATEIKIGAESSTAAVLKTGWNRTDAGRKYLKADGNLITENWLEDGGHLYYFDAAGLSVTGIRDIKNQKCTFNGGGELTSITRTFDAETKDTILSVQMKAFGKEADVSGIVKDSVAQDGNWIYYLFRQTAAADSTEKSSAAGSTGKTEAKSTSGGSTSAFPSLLRLKKDTGQTEIIADNASGYVMTENSIWYCKNNAVFMFAKSSTGTPVGNGSFLISESGGKYYLKDGYGKNVTGEGGYQTIEGRTYRVQDGLIKYVKPAPQSIGGLTFSANAAASDNKIYASGTAYLEQGLSVDSLTAIGNRLYYSVVLRTDGSLPVSQIWRVNVDTKEREAVSEEFPGRVLNLYYYSEKAALYMEYMPGQLNSSYGRIAVLSGGKILCLADEAARSGGYRSGNDMLELIWVEGNNVYCYWHDCAPKRSADGTLQVVSTTTLKLSDAVREPVSGVKATEAAGTGAAASSAAAKETTAGKTAAAVPSKASATASPKPASNGTAAQNPAATATSAKSTIHATVSPKP